VTIFSESLSLEDQLRKTNNRPSGFDYLRIILSISVVAWHSIEVCNGLTAVHLAWKSALRIPVFFILPSFFCLSGFLVSGSLLRVQKITTFLSLRAIRIFPALIVEVLLSALLIGPIFTRGTLINYLSSPLFRSYFLNIIGDIHYILPGVFINNPMPTVNAQLWTIPYELYCYATIVFLWVSGFLKNRTLVIISTIGLIIFVYVNLYIRGTIPNHFDRPPGKSLIISFLMGVIIFIFRERIRFNIFLFALSTILYIYLMFIPQTQYVAPIPIAYMTVYIGMTNPKNISALYSGDYSYEIYLYGYPIQQVISDILPQFRYWAIHFLLSLSVTILISIFSWQFIESKIIMRRKNIVNALGQMAYLVKRYTRGYFGARDRIG